MRLKGRSCCEITAWAATGRVQIEIGGLLRLTASPAQAVELARQLIKAVDDAKAAAGNHNQRRGRPQMSPPAPRELASLDFHGLIYPITGGAVAIEYPVATYLLAVLDVFIKMVTKQRGEPPKPPLEAVRNALADATRELAAYADESTEAIEGMADLAWNPDKFIDTTDAARMLGTTNANVRDLLRRGRLTGMDRNGRRLVDAVSLEDYRVDRDKRGVGKARKGA
jgi:hypothetical protein